MAECEVCKHDYADAFQILTPDGATHTFDSFACAIHALAPTCRNCGARVLNQGLVAGGRFFCSQHCLLASGTSAEGFIEN
jgi:hypothetical protein